MSLCAGAPTSQGSLYFLLSLWSGRRNMQLQLKPCRPSIPQIKRTYSSRPEEPLTHLSVFPGAPPRLLSPKRTNRSIKGAPESGEWREEGARTLIRLCNMLPFDTGQWNSISFFPLWSISIWRVSTNVVFLLSSAPCSISEDKATGDVEEGNNTWWALHAQDKLKQQLI